MNTGVPASFWVIVLFRYMLRSEIGKILWELCFWSFREAPYCSPQWLYQFTFPSTLQEGSLFSTHSPAFIVCRFFDDVTLSDLCDVVPHWSFDLISLITSDVEHFVTCFWPYVCLLSYCSVVSIGLNAYFMACTLVLFLKIRKLYLGFKIWNGAKLQHS